jgi:hypothetical protein
MARRGPLRQHNALTYDGCVPNATAPTIQLLAWIAEDSRGYAETIEVWKTSCPRLAVWEDALADDLVRVGNGCVVLTDSAKELLAAR